MLNFECNPQEAKKFKEAFERWLRSSFAGTHSPEDLYWALQNKVDAEWQSLFSYNNISWTSFDKIPIKINFFFILHTMFWKISDIISNATRIAYENLRLICKTMFTKY